MEADEERAVQHPWRPDRRTETWACVAFVFFSASVLLLFVMPLFSSPERGSASRHQCMSNMRQTMAGTFLYSTGYDDRLPGLQRWNDTLRPFVRTEAVFWCPAPWRRAGPFGHAFESRLSSVEYLKIPDPAERAMMFDSSTRFANVSDPLTSFRLTSTRSGAIGFLDGHASHKSRAVVDQARATGYFR